MDEVLSNDARSSEFEHVAAPALSHKVEASTARVGLRMLQSTNFSSIIPSAFSSSSSANPSSSPLSSARRNEGGLNSSSNVNHIAFDASAANVASMATGGANITFSRINDTEAAELVSSAGPQNERGNAVLDKHVMPSSFRTLTRRTRSLSSLAGMNVSKPLDSQDNSVAYVPVCCDALDMHY